MSVMLGSICDVTVLVLMRTRYLGHNYFYLRAILIVCKVPLVKYGIQVLMALEL